MLERGCALGLADACGSLAGLLEAGDGVPADPERARNLREQACEGGDGAACITLAVAAIDAGDAEEGRALLEKGCESDGRACTRRGLLALQAEKDPDTARMWFEKGCTGDLRDPDSCGWAGWLLHEGIGTEAEPARAEALITGACEAESATGCMFEAVVRARRGDAEKASELLGEACELEPEQCDGLTAQFEKLTK
jgi:TPR repeat protein